MPKPDDVLNDELAAAAGMSADDDLGMVGFGKSVLVLATPSGSVSTISVSPWLTSALDAEEMASTINRIRHQS